MGRGVFLLVSDGQCLPSGTGVLEPVFAVMHATQMLKSYNRRMAEQGWKCFLSNSKIENHLLFFFFPLGKDRNNSSSYDPPVSMKQFYMSSIFLPSFLHARFIILFIEKVEISPAWGLR